MGERQKYVVRSCSSLSQRHIGLAKYIGSIIIFDWPGDGLHNYWAAMFVRQPERTEVTYTRATPSGDDDLELFFFLLRYVITRVDEGTVPVFLANI